MLQQDDRTRRSNLYSSEDGVRTCRTYAVVQFHEPVAAELAGPHAAIVAGESVGATLRAAGGRVSKETRFTGSIGLPDPQHPVARLMRLDAAAELGVHAYRLRLDKAGQELLYATIVETHHPDYLTAAELRQLYAIERAREDPAVLPPGIVELVLHPVSID